MIKSRIAPAILTAPPLPRLDGSAPFRQGKDYIVPSQGGVYLIHDLRGILYVGKSTNLRRRFNDHYWYRENPLLAVALRHPVGDVMFSWSAALPPARDQLEVELIGAYQPPCNRLKYGRN